jgi:hypothetical protein
MGSAICQPKNLINNDDIITPTLPELIKKNEKKIN